MSSAPREAGRLLHRAFIATTNLVEDVHAAISDKTPSGLAKRELQKRDLAPGVDADSIAANVYDAVRGIGTMVSRTVGIALEVAESASASRSQAQVDEDDEIVPRKQGYLLARAHSLLNGAIGDQLDDERSPLAIKMSVREVGADIALSPKSLARAYAPAKGRVLVLLHGLGGDERIWSEDSDGEATLESSLGSRLGASVVRVRYNSGRDIGANGSDLSLLLDELVANWPVPIRRLDLVGHSMGGLVARSSCFEAARSRPQGWLRSLRCVVSIGSPHLGAPLATGAEAAARVLEVSDITKPFSDLIDNRSAGIKDLGYASLNGSSVELPDSVEFLSIGGTVTKNPQSLFARLLGDLMVLPKSAAVSADSQSRLVGGVHHGRLPLDRQVYEQLVEWLDAPTRMETERG